MPFHDVTWYQACSASFSAFAGLFQYGYAIGSVNSATTNVQNAYAEHYMVKIVVAMLKRNLADHVVQLTRWIFFQFYQLYDELIFVIKKQTNVLFGTFAYLLSTPNESINCRKSMA